MAWTHIYDLLLKLASMVLAVLVVTQIPLLPDYGFLPFALMLVLFAVLYYGFFRTVSTLLYSKYTLGMSLTWAQAKTLNDAFSPVLPVKWLPLKYIKDIAPEEARYPVALAALTDWLNQKQRLSDKQKIDFKNSKQTTKVLTVVMAVLIIYFIAAGFLNLPPANYIAAAFCKFFNTERYYPLLDSIILVVPTYIIFKLIDKDIK